jgi:transposase
MNIKYHGHQPRTDKARELWLRIATDYAGGMSATVIAKRHKVTRSHVYWILKKIQTEPIN